jgi:hypothetical protein
MGSLSLANRRTCDGLNRGAFAGDVVANVVISKPVESGSV